MLKITFGMLPGECGISDEECTPDQIIKQVHNIVKNRAFLASAGQLCSGNMAMVEERPVPCIVWIVCLTPMRPSRGVIVFRLVNATYYYSSSSSSSIIII